MSWLSDGWELAKGAADSAGEFLEDAYETGREMAGQALDTGFDAASGVARRIGANGVADALTDTGDFIASATGGAVDELELGSTDEPKKLVRGEPSAIEGAVATLSELSGGIDATGDALAAIDAADWTGDAADAFNAVFDKQPGLWTEASGAMDSAGQILTSWRHVVEAAQGRAADAIDLWKQAEQEEASRKAAHDALDADARGQTPLVDSWTAQKAAAQEILRGARAERDTAAGQIADALRATTALAPTEPPFTDRMVANLADTAGALDMASANFTSGLLTGLSGIVQFTRQVNPLDHYNMTHPAEYGAAMSDMATGLVVAVADPGAVTSAMLSDIRENPFEFIGGLTGDAALTVATGGAGGGVAAVRGVERVIDTMSDLGNLTRSVDTIADVGRHLPDSGSDTAGRGLDPRLDHETTVAASNDSVVDDLPPSGRDGGSTPYLDADDIEYFNGNGDPLLTEDLRHPKIDLLDVGRLESDGINSGESGLGATASDPLVQELTREYYSLGPVNPADMNWADGNLYPDGFMSPVDRYPAILEPGLIIDRFGGTNGNFLSPDGVPYHERALSPRSLDLGYHRYEVLDPVPVWAGHAAPAQGMPGGGEQYFTPWSVAQLLSGGYIREVG